MSIDTVAGAKEYKKDIEKTIQEKLDSIKEYGKALEKALNKEKWDDVRHNNHMITMCFEHKKYWEEKLPECDFFITKAEWIESGYKTIVDYLEKVFWKDMEWYRELKDKVQSMTKEEIQTALKQKTMNANEYVIAKMSEEQAKKEFRKDILYRLKKLINRVEKKAGKIIDTQYLDINPLGELDGKVIGEEATVWVTTIGAGGYNIQRFHFRTLVK